MQTVIVCAVMWSMTVSAVSQDDAGSTNKANILDESGYKDNQYHVSVRANEVVAGLRRKDARPWQVHKSIVRRVANRNANSYRSVMQPQASHLSKLNLTEAVLDQVHCVFVTNCNTNSHQADVLQYSALRVKQPGPITRIVYGCTAADEDTLRRRSEAMFPKTEDGSEFFLHFAPVSAPVGSSRAMPKVLGVEHWVATVGPQRRYVAILDDDFIFLSPLTRKLSREHFGDAWHNYQDVPAEVSKGVTMAAHYRDFFPDNKFHKTKFFIRPNSQLKIDPGAICRGDDIRASPCDDLIDEDVFGHSVGAPYMIEASDLRTVAPSWSLFALRLARAGEGFHADMHGWMLAIVHHQLRQIRHDRLMMSSPSNDKEYWGFVDGERPLECSAPVTWKDKTMHTSIFLHYCQHFKVGHMDLYKGQSHTGQKFSTLACNSSERIPLPPREAQGKSRMDRRAYFGYCTLASTLHEAIGLRCSHEV
jgi:hypothetical protein